MRHILLHTLTHTGEGSECVNGSRLFLSVFVASLEDPGGITSQSCISTSTSLHPEFLTGITSVKLKRLSMHNTGLENQHCCGECPFRICNQVLHTVLIWSSKSWPGHNNQHTWFWSEEIYPATVLQLCHSDPIAHSQQRSGCFSSALEKC